MYILQASLVLLSCTNKNDIRFYSILFNKKDIAIVPYASLNEVSAVAVWVDGIVVGFRWNNNKKSLCKASGLATLNFNEKFSSFDVNKMGVEAVDCSGFDFIVPLSFVVSVVSDI